MKMKPKMPKTGGKASTKPHVRMRHLKPAPGGAFPQSPLAFPPGGGPMDNPGQAMSAPPGGMPTGAAPGDMGE